MTDPSAVTVPRCFKHPDRETYIRCQRCGRYICPDCMHQASVGFHCPKCVAEGAASTPRARTSYGGAVVTGGSGLVTKAIIAVNVAVFLLIHLTGGVTSPLLLRMELVARDFFFQGSVYTGVDGGAYWRLLTSTFVHVQTFHLLFNMFAVWIFGPALESLLGRWRYLALYLACALAGSVSVYLLTIPNVPTIGASGAVFGLLGAALVISYQRKLDITWLLVMLGFNLVYGFIRPDISWQGHVGGLLAGLVLGVAIAYAPRPRRGLVQGSAYAVVLAACVVITVARTLALTG
jgi:membrane associated rhomboid family serine protease